MRGRRPSEATVAAYLDRSVFNLSSIVILAEFKRKRMLLTGDARGDDILAGLRSSGLLDRRRFMSTSSSCRTTGAIERRDGVLQAA